MSHSFPVREAAILNRPAPSRSSLGRRTGLKTGGNPYVTDYGDAGSPRGHMLHHFWADSRNRPQPCGAAGACSC